MNFCVCVKWYNSLKLIDRENKLIDTENRLVTSRGGSWEVTKWIKGVKCVVVDGNYLFFMVYFIIFLNINLFILIGGYYLTIL